MGGCSYDRDVYSSSSNSGWGSSFGTSSNSRSAFKETSLRSDMKPNGKILESNTKTPIIIVLDVTGSNIDFARVVYDKLPMFYGQIEQKGYLDNFDIAICAVGDAYTDSYPLQIGSFEKGIDIDSWIKKIVLEGCGGGQVKESYELAAYYLYKNTKFAENAEPIIFFLGDEKPYPNLNKSQVEKFGIEWDLNEEKNPFTLLREKVNNNVFMLLNKYCGRGFDMDITKTWEKLLSPEHVIRIREEKSIIDLMLGIISMISKSRDIDEYSKDMKDRGQTESRITNVTKALKDLAESLDSVEVDESIFEAENKSTNPGTRL